MLRLLSCKWIGLELKFCNPSESEKNFSSPWWYSVWQAKAGNGKCISIYYFLSCWREFLNKDRTEFFFELGTKRGDNDLWRIVMHSPKTNEPNHALFLLVNLSTDLVRFMHWPLHMNMCRNRYIYNTITGPKK